MREIKFKLWDSDCSTMILPEDSKTNQIRMWLNGVQAEDDVWIQNCVLLQFTGLKDKNGKEIYEGDIIDYFPGKKYGIIVWDNELAGFCLNVDNLRFSWHENNPFIADYKIIGNIYENPELLK